MNGTLNGNGNGDAQTLRSTLRQIKKDVALEETPVPSTSVKDSRVTFETIGGTKHQASLLRMTRNASVIELYDPTLSLRLSEVLDKFKITFQERVIYSGRATVRNIIDVKAKIVCEAQLEDGQWGDLELGMSAHDGQKVGEEFKKFVGEWQKFYKVLPEFKVVVTDMQIFLSDLQSWLEQIESQIRSLPAAKQAESELQIANALRDPVIGALNSLFERFEVTANKIEEDLRPAHRAFSRRQLHQFFLNAPFLYRTYAKPLGYAGDYEMMNMIVRNGMEGKSLFAKLINAYLLNHAPCRAVRNRADFLTSKILAETARVSRSGGVNSIFCVACGPAWEAVNFIADSPLSNQAKFQLLDFEQETLKYTSKKINDIKRKHQRQTQVSFVKNSVQNLLRGRNRTTPKEKFDLIYCSGLYDYLSDRVCKELNTYLYDLLQPGGLLVVGNFAAHTPGQNLMEHLMEWFLIYRTSAQLATLAPENAPAEDCVVSAEPTGSNIFLEVRKSE
jgi:extracellular factor (EF) 3-hydroxypalmitic acid methyl ester biosynthesis protein